MILTRLDLKIPHNLTLKPNCLITRRPLVFLTPPRSLFFYKNPWGFIKNILYEHGYSVNVFQLPFQNIQIQKNVIENNFSYLEKKHLFIDSVTYENLKLNILKIKNSTLTVICEDQHNNSHKLMTHFIFNPENHFFSLRYSDRHWLRYWLHQKWCFLRGLKTPTYSETLSQMSENSWHQFLDHCVHLAEIDFQQD